MASEDDGSDPSSRTEAASESDGEQRETASATTETSETGPEEFDEGEWRLGGKTSHVAHVPASIAEKAKDKQQTGATAEQIVLNAVLECHDRLPQLIRAARGQIHTEGSLFPGLEMIDRGPGRPKKVEQANARLQFQLSPQFKPRLMKVAKQHNLKLSTLVRLCLGDYFNVPVRIGRVR